VYVQLNMRFVAGLASLSLRAQRARKTETSHDEYATTAIEMNLGDIWSVLCVLDDSGELSE
jgi:hypothetical protein